MPKIKSEKCWSVLCIPRWGTEYNANFLYGVLYKSFWGKTVPPEWKNSWELTRLCEGGYLPSCNNNLERPNADADLEQIWICVKRKDSAEYQCLMSAQKTLRKSAVLMVWATDVEIMRYDWCSMESNFQFTVNVWEKLWLKNLGGWLCKSSSKKGSLGRNSVRIERC